MNERIKQLAEQAYEQQPLMIANPETFEIEHKIGNGGVPMYTREFNQEKFAELIVEECMYAVGGCYYKDEFDGVKEYLPATDFIKKHFGVEY